MDIENDWLENTQVVGWNGGTIHRVRHDIRDWLPPRTEYRIVFAFPPCNNLATSGARWFKDKGLAGLASAIELVEKARDICEWADAPWMIENPMSTLSTYWRKPDYTFHPWMYGDNYTKKTCLWTGDGFKMPPPDTQDPPDDVDVDYIHKQPDSKGRQKKRSLTPAGFARAVYEANK